jgi:phytoene dehydrogenase-like protein
VSAYDAVVVGAGPNGLAAAIELARSGRSVLVREARPTVGGGARSEELTLPGFTHDVCSAVLPLAAASPFFRTLPLAEHGLEWVHPRLPLAHPLDDGSAVLLDRSLEATAVGLGEDERAYRRLFGPIVEAWPKLEPAILRPLAQVPRAPVTLARFSLQALRSARALTERLFATERARALLAGAAAHSILPLEQRATASYELVLATTAHVVGWPFARGGTQRLADALASYLRTLGGEIETNAPVESLDELPSARLVLCDVTPKQLLRLAGDRLPDRYRRTLERYRYGPGVFKMDWALDGPIPWAAEECAGGGTVHLGGTLEEIAASERGPWTGEHAERPFVLLAQPTLFDDTRAPAGKHTAWAYCHVPNGSTVDMTERIERQVERFAPGFQELVLARSALGPADLEQRNRNLIGGDITGGAQNLWQLIARPALRPVPYRTPVKGLYLCSASTPPGGAVHGMCGFWAARAALCDDDRY